MGVTTPRPPKDGELFASASCKVQPGPDLKRTLVAMSERTGMTVSQVTEEVLYTGLIEMQEL